MREPIIEYTDSDGDDLFIEPSFSDGTEVYVDSPGAFVPLKTLRKALRRYADRLIAAKGAATYGVAVSDRFGDAVNVDSNAAGVFLTAAPGTSEECDFASFSPKQARRLARYLEEAAAVAEAAKETTK